MTTELQPGSRYFSIGFDRDIRAITLLRITSAGLLVECDGYQWEMRDLDNLYRSRQAASRAAARKKL